VDGRPGTELARHLPPLPPVFTARPTPRTAAVSARGTGAKLPIGRQRSMHCHSRSVRRRREAWRGATCATTYPPQRRVRRSHRPGQQRHPACPGGPRARHPRPRHGVGGAVDRCDETGERCRTAPFRRQLVRQEDIRSRRVGLTSMVVHSHRNAGQRRPCIGHLARHALGAGDHGMTGSECPPGQPTRWPTRLRWVRTWREA
jgi:hypothetical protein